MGRAHAPHAPDRWSSKMGEMQNARPVEAIRPDVWPKVDRSSVRYRCDEHNRVGKSCNSCRGARKIFILQVRLGHSRGQLERGVKSALSLPRRRSGLPATRGRYHAVASHSARPKIPVSSREGRTATGRKDWVYFGTRRSDRS